MGQITCIYCSTVVETTRLQRKLCDSEDCRRQYTRDATAKSRAKKRQPTKNICRECNAEFGPVEGKKLYCSYDCGRAAHLRNRREREYAPPVRFCDFCKGQIPYKSGKRRYCSLSCRAAGIAKEARWRVKGLDPSVPLSSSCELCGATDRQLDIDHDHKCCPSERACGKCFRGMLCRPCNVALGMFREDPQLLRAAASYIEARAASRPAGP